MRRHEAVALVARREVRERVRSGLFITMTIVSILLTVGLVIAPTVLGSLFGVRTYTVGVVGTLTSPMQATLDVVVPQLGPRVQVERLASRGHAEAALEEGRVQVAILPGPTILVQTELGERDFGGLARLVRVLSLGPVTSGDPVPVEGLHPPKADASRRPMTLYAIGLTYAFILLYGQWIASGVAEEKSSRVVEILLAAVPPSTLLLGKVVGIGAVALGQGAMIAATGYGAGRLIDAGWVQVSRADGVLALLGWFVLAYAFYCALYAAIGAMVSREQESQNAMFPLMVPLIVAFMVSSSAVGGEDSALLVVFSFLPATAPITMPMRVAIGTAPAWQAWLSAGVMLAGTLLVGRLAGAVYARSLLRTGSKVRLRDVIRTA